MKNKELKQNLLNMKISVKLIEEHLKNYFNKKEHYNESKINPIVIRNISYINTVTNRIKNNINFVNKIEKNNENKLIIRKKTLISLVLLKHINEIIRKYSIEETDFEIQNYIFMKNGVPGFISNMSKNVKNSIEEEFKIIKKENKIIEGFNLNSIKNFFNKIASTLNGIIKGIAKIANFIGNYLKKFIMFMWRLLKYIYNLIFKVIPKIIKNVYNFFRILLIKLAKVGFFTVLLLVSMIMILLKYWQILLEVNGIPMPIVIVPAVIIVLHLFWKKTNFLYKLQMSILNGIIKLITGPLKTIFIVILGLPKKDRFYKYKGKNQLKKISLFLAMIIKNLPMIVTRFLITILVLKYIIKYGASKLMLTLPSFREIILFPIIIIKYICFYTWKFVKNKFFVKDKKID